MPVTIAEILVADPPEAWRAAGFAVDDDGGCRIGTVRIGLGVEGRGVVGWSLRDLPAGTTDLDGVPTTGSADQPAEPARHPNGTTHVDHVVLLTPHLARTVAALESIGLDVRRERDGALGGAPMRQVFFRLGEVVLEVVGSPDATGEGPASIWGLTHAVADIDAAAALLGEHTTPVKDAVQPGRRITTVRTRELGISVRTALISQR
ncbi:VOC family protein [Nocardioides sp. LML1-1-1.1]|uniref:VOC family protein n=1 Tax=Nocardioides sp. LML1-1-1.1 TaxID=3135248 RepID=UPI00342CD314